VLQHAVKRSGPLETPLFVLQDILTVSPIPISISHPPASPLP
jgi:hypothetical protein